MLLVAKVNVAQALFVCAFARCGTCYCEPEHPDGVEQHPEIDKVDLVDVEVAPVAVEVHLEFDKVDLVDVEVALVADRVQPTPVAASRASCTSPAPRA